jgi:deoxyribodipyrimidine photo-lyase
MSVPSSRVFLANRQPLRPDKGYVLCWLLSSRRPTWNYSLQRAVEHAVQLRKPLVILEAVELDYPWASQRLHQCIIDGMLDASKHFSMYQVLYHPYVEPAPGEGRGLVEALAADACMVVTDQFPCFFLPKIVAAAAARLPCRLEAVDSNGLFPLSLTPSDFPTAYAFRRFLQKNLAEHLEQLPKEDPLRGALLPPPPALPESLLRRWPSAITVGISKASRVIPDAAVPPVDFSGGVVAGQKRLQGFLARLERYGEERNDPDADVASGLSPYLHFGQISVHAIFAALAEQEGWSPDKLSKKKDGHREGWWGMSAAAESFLDELVTWRELGYTFCHHRPDYAEYSSLPEWARQTLEKHAADPRPVVYSRQQLEQARTHDPLWNAAQRQLRQEGRIHNYLRMLWGKKILQWSESPQVALEHLIDLNNRWALDGRNPNSYSGIFWTLGRFDRAWGPERPIFGTIRYMASENTAKKWSVNEYLRRFGERGLFSGRAV